MKLTVQDYAQALYDALQETKDHDKVLDNFVKILAQNGDLGKHQQIEDAYKLLEMKQKGISEATVTVAREMEINSKIIDDLNKIINPDVGADTIRPLQVEIKKQIDEGIVGGVVVRVDDTLIDASIKTQLNNLNQSLKN